MQPPVRRSLTWPHAVPLNAPVASDTLRVVIADDAPAVRAHLLDRLAQIKRVEVVGEAENSPQAVAAVNDTTPDLVVLDIQMPGMNGIQALKRIKRDHPATTVIMLTNHSNPYYRQKCMAEGASYFFDKSNDFDELEATGRFLAAEA